MIDLMIVGESPSYTRPKGMENVNFSGKTSHILWDELQKHDITREDCFVTNVVDKALPKGQKPTAKMIEDNRDRIQKEIADNQPLLLLPMGKIATEAVLTEGIKIIDVEPRVIWSERYNIWTVPCIHPGAVARRKLYLTPQFRHRIWLAAKALDICKSISEDLRNEYSRERRSREQTEIPLSKTP